MIAVGKVLEIWRYPVSSLGGEMCDQVDVAPSGLRGDRQYALFDPLSGSVAAPEKEARWRPALFLKSAIDAEGAKIGFLDGSWRSLVDPQLKPMLAAHFGFEVAVGRYASFDERTLSLLQLKNRYDLAPLHLLTTTSLRELKRAALQATIDRRRFRPNILVDGDAEIGFTETHWVGNTLQIDAVTAKVSEPTKRCGMTFIPQPGLEEQAEVLRTIVRQNRRSFGIYCNVTKPGRIQLGATITRIDDNDADSHLSGIKAAD